MPRIEIEGGSEIPILDGSALGWTIQVQMVGVRNAPLVGMTWEHEEEATAAAWAEDDDDVEDEEEVQQEGEAQRPPRVGDWGEFEPVSGRVLFFIVILPLRCLFGHLPAPFAHPSQVRRMALRPRHPILVQDGDAFIQV